MPVQNSLLWLPLCTSFLIGAVEKYPSNPVLKCLERWIFAQPPMPKVGLLISKLYGLSPPNWYHECIIIPPEKPLMPFFSSALDIVTNDMDIIMPSSSLWKFIVKFLFYRISAGSARCAESLRVLLQSSYSLPLLWQSMVAFLNSSKYGHHSHKCYRNEYHTCRMK